MEQLRKNILLAQYFEGKKKKQKNRKSRKEKNGKEKELNISLAQKSTKDVTQQYTETLSTLKKAMITAGSAQEREKTWLNTVLIWQKNPHR